MTNNIDNINFKYINSIDKYNINGKLIYIFSENHIKYNTVIDDNFGVKYLEYKLKPNNNTVLYLEVYDNLDIYKIDKFDFNSDNINYMLNLKKLNNMNNIFLSDYRHHYLDIQFIKLLYNTNIYNDSIDTKLILNVLIDSLSNKDRGLFFWLKSDKYKIMFNIIPDYINNMNTLINIATQYITDLSKNAFDIINTKNYTSYVKIINFLKFYFLNINDFFILRDILFRHITESYILIGQQHALNLKNLLQKFLIKSINF